MPKKVITFTDEMERVIQREAERRGAPFASVVREAVVEWAAKRGITIRAGVEWGGPRVASEGAKEEGQEVAVAVP